MAFVNPFMMIRDMARVAEDPFEDYIQDLHQHNIIFNILFNITLIYIGVEASMRLLQLTDEQLQRELAELRRSIARKAPFFIRKGSHWQEKDVAEIMLNIAERQTSDVTEVTLYRRSWADVPGPPQPRGHHLDRRGHWVLPRHLRSFPKRGGSEVGQTPGTRC